ncbi:hypothetical protein ACFOET_08750 [Parapedobacter deserti]|uniref:Uncharacterized protein n=1 Tax=Parapedobacter deserti TaxID=1912957 RepID=A0ABV7JLJ4_9SPHI
MIFQLFIPNKQQHFITVDGVVVVLWLVYFTIFWGFEGLLFSKGSLIGMVYGISLVCVSLFLLIAFHFRYEPLRGKLQGDIVLAADGIHVNDHYYALTDITSIDFFVGDYYGHNPPMRHTLNPRLSQGVNNYIKFTDAIGKEHQYYFKLFSANGSQELYPIIKQATVLGKMPLLRGLELLGINDYDEIQRFKAEHFKG